MRVIDHEPQLWYLLEENGALLFDVSCEYSFVSYEFLMFLVEDEVLEYRRVGRSYLNKLAEEINYSGPGVRGSKSEYKSRFAEEYSSKVINAIRMWRERSTNGLA